MAVLFRFERLYCCSSRRLSGLSSARAWLGKMKTRSASSPAPRMRSTSSVISSSGSTYSILAMSDLHRAHDAPHHPAERLVLLVIALDRMVCEPPGGQGRGA